MGFNWVGEVNEPAAPSNPVPPVTTVTTGAGPTNIWLRYAQSGVMATAKLYGQGLAALDKRTLNVSQHAAASGIKAGANSLSLVAAKVTGNKVAAQHAGTALKSNLGQANQRFKADVNHFNKPTEQDIVNVAMGAEGGGGLKEAPKFAADYKLVRPTPSKAISNIPEAHIQGAAATFKDKVEKTRAAVKQSTEATGKKTAVGSSHPAPVIDGYQHSQEMVHDYADMLRSMDKGAKGGQIVGSGEGYTRTSEHSPLYRQYFAEHGLAPTKEAYLEQAQKELASGKGAYGASDTYKQLVSREKVAAAPVESPSLEAKMSRHKVSAPKKEPEPLVNQNKTVKSIVSKLTPERFKGKLNPVDSAAREGHTTFANVSREVAGKKIYALRHGNEIANRFDKAYADYLVHGGTHQQFIKDIESGNTPTKAHELWVQIHQQTGEALLKSGAAKAIRDETYVGRVGRFPGKSAPSRAAGLSKGGGFSKARLQAMADEFGNSSDKFKTHADYASHVEAHGGIVLKDPRDILRHTLPAKLEAVENAKGLSKLDRTAMADGRPATVTFNQEKGLPHEFSDYQQGVLPGRAVHPGASNTLKALTHTYTQDELHNPVARINSVTKRLVTLNGLVHAKNFGLASLRKQGFIHTAIALVKSNQDLGKTFGEENIKRAVTKGGVVPFEQAKQDLFDKVSQNKALTPSRAWNKLTSPFSAIHHKVNDVLFNKVGNHLQFSTYFNVEKQMLKQGLSADEAARVAGSSAKNVSFISSPIESSVEFRKSSRLVFFAGQYFKSTLNEAAKAVGVSSDKTLSTAGQRAMQKDAIKGLARGFTYLFALAQGINYANTGHSTFQNKDSKLSPVVYMDKHTGKQYHMTNWYGQLGDILHITNPQEWLNKIAPGLQTLGRMGLNKDYFGQPIRDTSASDPKQMLQVLGYFMENTFTPAGLNLDAARKQFGKGGQPGAVTGLNYLGYGTSTKDQTPMEKQIDKLYGANLPANVKYDQQLSTLKATAANDLKQGKSDSPALSQLKSQVTSAQYKSFVKSGTLSSATAHFDKLSPDQKMKILQKYQSQDLKQLDLTTFMTDLAYKKATVEALHNKGYTDSQIEQVVQKAGYNHNQLNQLRSEAKRQAAVQRKTAGRHPAYVSPFTR